MHRLMIFCFALCWMSFESIADTTINGVRFGSLSNGQSRIVLDLSGKITPTLTLLSDPYRVVVDIPDSKWGSRPVPKASGIISRLRHNVYRPSVYRIVLDLNKAGIVANHFYLAPINGYGHRYVIDVRPTSRSNFLATSKKMQTAVATKAPPKPKKVKRKRTGKKIIVLDPGHGGRDPGTLGRYGSHEAVLTLKIANELKTQLEKTGRYKVYLTRYSNVQLHRNKSRDLRMRYEVAKKRDADLFISIHVDAVDNTKTRGGSVYSLSERASDKEAARLVAKENREDILTGVDLEGHDKQVSNILIELAQRETLNNSAQFAEVLVREMRKKVKMLKTGHRYGPLMVLKAPDIPSVLIETGYQTNRQDAKLLNSKWGQRQLASGIKSGIEMYFRTNKTAMAN
ncbi:N-acetylmuramoyl-L-alanine amidase [Temperatibacter marinus]|uniref:N-acetylmuramoyl-L-alanine amidase n=1 Tax=Temperatibacter marinus TaxID=1456591 RepID=A0AA52ECK4_9PROT|nr:N-acetylmuramoyl-L-alanine amidase [Temperatibacter marinus]WND02281.1 N-acetylmuramoyl-L-alanine amidase [Temperatibacter marinus]